MSKLVNKSRKRREAVKDLSIVLDEDYILLERAIERRFKTDEEKLTYIGSLLQDLEK